MSRASSTGHPPLALAALLAGSVAACGAPAVDDGPTCPGRKCDALGGDAGPPAELCELRHADAFDPNKLAFTKNFLRWSCNDTPGVDGDERGQEYCEYFAIVELPPPVHDEPAPPAAILGRHLGPSYDDGTTPSGVSLTEAQLAALEATPDALVGDCVFTSWNNDIPGRCAGHDCPSVRGVLVDEATFQMVLQPNSLEAAANLVEDCTGLGVGVSEEVLAIDDDFERGCMINAEINATAYRKSDTFVCTAANRLAECGCEMADGTTLHDQLSGLHLRGFKLGTWSSVAHLPPGCRQVDLGDHSRTVVTCDLTAAEVITYAGDLKSFCQAKYADNVVVHVPMPAPDKIACAHECAERPWLLEP